MPPSTNKLQNPPKNNQLAGVVSLAVIVGLVALFGLYRQPLSDWWQLRDYQAPADISQLATQDTMTATARHLFYLNKPQLIASVAPFRQNCPENESTIILGCYHPSERGVYLYEVKDSQLQGVTQVTAAHETLHAIYDRLSNQERQRVNGLLMDYYNHGLTDPRVKAEIGLYQQTEPSAVVNEMHSVFGTEVANLPPALEAYYKRYFTNRAAIVADSQNYEQVFSSRQAKIMQDDQQLVAMKQQIDSQEANLQTQQDQLTGQQNQMKALLAAGQTDQYNAMVPTYNAGVRAYNSDIASLKNLIDSYNQLVAVRNAIASELATLDKALDTRLAPQTIH